MIRPTDVCVLLHLRLYPADSYAAMAERLGISKSTAHGGVARLIRNRLARSSSKLMAIVMDGPAMEFLSYGVPYAFAPDTVPAARGILTGLQALSSSLDSEIATPAMLFVWPSKLGDARGMGIEPLIPAAAYMPNRDRRLYHLLALVDALRMGDARERAIARDALRNRFVQPA